MACLDSGILLLNVGALQMLVRRGSWNVLLLKFVFPLKALHGECVTFLFFFLFYFSQKKRLRLPFRCSFLLLCVCTVCEKFPSNPRHCVYLALPPTHSLRSLKIVSRSQIDALSSGCDINVREGWGAPDGGAGQSVSCQQVAFYLIHI